MTAKPKPRCRICDKPSPSAYLCKDCVETLERALGDIPAIDTRDDKIDPAIGVQRHRYRRSLLAELELTRTRQGRGGSLTRSGSSRDYVLWADTRGAKRVDDAIDALRNALSTWTRRTEEERRGFTGHTASDVAGYLSNHVHWIAAQPWGDELYRDIVHGVRGAEHIIDRNAHDRWWMGPCRAEWEPDGNPASCVASIWGAPDAATVVCEHCGYEWEVQARREWLLFVAEETLAHGKLIADALSNILDAKITDSMIRGYALRARIVRRGLDLAGRELFRVGDVLEVVRQVQADKQRSAQQRTKRTRRISA